MECTEFTCVTTHCKIIKHILIIEDSLTLSQHLKENIDRYFGFRCDTAINENEAKEMIRRKRYDLIITDLYLPDSSANFISDLIQSNLRVIVMTGSDNSEKRSEILALPIVDYVLKSDAKTLLDYLIKTIQRLNENRSTIIAICDDSKLARSQIIQLLIPQNLSYVEFENGEQAYKCINNDAFKVDVLLTDYEMPRMNGLDLIRHLRHRYLSDELPIISISASDKPHLLVQFLKTGASDYLKKPFGNEEFLIRLNITLEYLYTSRRNKALVEQLEKTASHDFMTQLYNRTHYFSQIDHITADAIRHNRPYGVMMIDIDHFKKINDTYGHHAGDVAIQYLASALKSSARTSDYCFRWGGEEFLILVPSTTHEELAQFGERLRSFIENSTVEVESEALSFKITISVGAAIGLESDTMGLISKADEMLYGAKTAGRNCVKIAS